MTIRDFVKNLRRSNVGEIYWANFSMQVAVGILDISHGQNIFRRAAENYMKYMGGKAGGDASVGALQALNLATISNQDAIHNCGPDRCADEIPQYCSNVITGQNFYSYCLSEDAQDAIRDISIEIRAKSPQIFDVVPDDYISQVFEAGYTTVDIIKREFPRVGNFLAPKINIRTRYDRFWLGSDPQENQGSAADISNRLALGYPDGEFLVRLSFEKEKLFAALSSNGLNLPCRPFAFCVNDTNEPRFRGRRAMETSDKSTHFPSGQTVHLTGDPTPSDGLREWICEAVTLNSSDVRVEFLGRISGAAKVPDAQQFLKYLDDHRGASCSLDQSLIDQLVGEV